MSRSRCHAHVWLTNRSAKWWKKYASHSRRVQQREELSHADIDYTMDRKKSSRVNAYTSPKDDKPGWGSDTLDEQYKTRGK
jgi:hypothetical protein